MVNARPAFLRGLADIKASIDSGTPSSGRRRRAPMFREGGRLMSQHGHAEPEFDVVVTERPR